MGRKKKIILMNNERGIKKSNTPELQIKSFKSRRNFQSLYFSSTSPISKKMFSKYLGCCRHAQDTQAYGCVMLLMALGSEVT